MDPVTLSTIASVLMKAGPSLLRTVGGWFGGDTAKTADSVAGIVENVNSVINPQDQQRVRISGSMREVCAALEALVAVQ